MKFDYTVSFGFHQARRPPCYERIIRRKKNPFFTNCDTVVAEIHYVYDIFGLGSITAAYDGEGNLIASYAYGYGLLSQTDGAGNAAYYGYDHLGSTVVMTDAAGGVVNQYAYDPYGGSLYKNEAISNPFQFVGEFGVATGMNDSLISMRARWYDPALGRFVSEDPIGLGGGINLYQYAINSPMRYIDPSGNIGINTNCNPDPNDNNKKNEKKKKDDDDQDPPKPNPQPVFEPGTMQNDRAKNTAGPPGTRDIGNFMLGLDLVLGVGLLGLTVFQPELAPVTVPFGLLLISPSLFGSQQTQSNALQSQLYNNINIFVESVSIPETIAGAMSDDSPTGIVAMASSITQCPTPPPPPPPPVPPPGPPGGGASVPRSVDPNEIRGPYGYGEDGWIIGSETLAYEIHFENDAIATAPAQRVDIEQYLDKNLEWSTLEFTGFGFADVYVALPAGSWSVNEIVEMTVTPLGSDEPVMIHVEVLAGIDLTTGRIYASFQTVDPESPWGLPPFDVNVGFLLPTLLDASKNPVDFRGMGFLSYVVNTKSGLVTNDTIKSVAKIQFDFDEIIYTNQIDPHDPSKGTDPDKECRLTIDKDTPTSSVIALPEITDTRRFTASWEGNDIGSGIAYYDIYVSVDGGEYELWQKQTPETSAEFTGQNGKTYAFVSVATDNVGFTEAIRLTSDTVTTLDVEETPPDAPANAAAEATSSSEILVSWELSENTDLYNIYRSTTETEEFVLVASVEDLFFADTELTAKTTYYYRIYAYNTETELESENYAAVSATTLKATTDKPEFPSIIVTTWDDVVDEFDGHISLREAILYASPGDIILLDLEAPVILELLDGEFFIDKSITIQSVGASFIIKAAGNSRVFNIASGVTVTLIGLAITGGVTDGNGGAISNAGELYLYDCDITGNEAKRGGGIASTGTTTIIGGTISGNTSHSYGGGVYVQSGITTITDCIITGNKMAPVPVAGGAVSGGSGGGVYNAGTLFVTGGEITNNKAPLFSGGGLSNEGKATIENCLVARNSAEWAGGVSNSNHGTMTIIGGEKGTIEENMAKQGYGGIGNAGNLTLIDVPVKNNTAHKLGGGLGNNTGTVTLQGTTDISKNFSDDEYKDIWTKTGSAETWYNTTIAPASASFVPVAPVYEISAPTEGELFAKTLTYWEFSAVSISSAPIKDWEINWGDGSENTVVLGGPRSRINVTHYFCVAGTYSVTIKTTDFDGVVNTITIGTYTIKERVVEPLVVESFAWVEPELAFGFDTQEFSLLEEPAMVSFAAPLPFAGENRIENYLADLAETMRQRQMLDLDQLRSSGQKADNIAFSDLVWADDDIFGDEWINFSEPEESDFWNEVFENDLLLLKTGV
ncbi:MAG: hypothetical protein FWC43_00350 [Planctomycetaceae bacterium]|nr:hypothetical protein [Planctomycetaceae bacterium]